MGNGMNKVLPGLYVGNFRDSKDPEQLTENNITHILAIHDNAKKLHLDKEYLCISAADSPGQNLTQFFTTCNDFIHMARLNGGNVLIHCLAGVSRSVTVAVAYVMSVTNLSWREALNAVRGARDVANPNFGFQRQLHDYEKHKLNDERRRLRQRYPFCPSMLEDEEFCRKLIVLCHQSTRPADPCRSPCHRRPLINANYKLRSNRINQQKNKRKDFTWSQLSSPTSSPQHKNIRRSDSVSTASSVSTCSSSPTASPSKRKRKVSSGTGSASSSGISSAMAIGCSVGIVTGLFIGSGTNIRSRTVSETETVVQTTRALSTETKTRLKAGSEIALNADTASVSSSVATTSSKRPSITRSALAGVSHLYNRTIKACTPLRFRSNSLGAVESVNASFSTAPTTSPSLTINTTNVTIIESQPRAMTTPITDVICCPIASMDDEFEDDDVIENENEAKDTVIVLVDTDEEWITPLSVVCCNNNDAASAMTTIEEPEVHLDNEKRKETRRKKKCQIV
ncbi:hypothetical protein CHUAL_011567 [Chamberlinius hualienensis]